MQMYRYVRLISTYSNNNRVKLADFSSLIPGFEKQVEVTRIRRYKA